MIIKTMRHFKRQAVSWRKWPADTTQQQHVERVQRETWWLLWVVPIYCRETLLSAIL